MVSRRHYLLAWVLLWPLAGSAAVESSHQVASGPGGAVDPYESINRLSWELNYSYLDRYALRPVVHSYVEWVPQPVRNGVGNFTENFNEANYFVNNLLVGRVVDSGTSVLRFAVNSTFGLFGFVDVAQDMGLERRAMSMSTVQRGDSLVAIARRFGCELRDVAKANKLKAPKYAIRPGQSLKLEGCKE